MFYVYYRSYALRERKNKPIPFGFISKLHFNLMRKKN